MLTASTASVPMHSHVFKSGTDSATTALGYLADTEGRCSGSPLLSYSDKLGTTKAGLCVP